MTQNQGSEPVPASRTGQLISARDMAMQKFEEGMRLISEASELCGLSLFTSRIRHCCKVSDEAAFCLIQRPYISKTLLTRRISPRGSP
ncbi:hypothetical protein FJK76_02330 [Escherichia coli]|nr:hypothetical protein [Escherichia coli]MCE4231819.1 hypothetical protein [Escherichia coli]